MRGLLARCWTDGLSLAAASPAEDLFPGRRYDGGLDSGFHSVDSGSKRWSGNEVRAYLPRDIGGLGSGGKTLSQDPLLGAWEYQGDCSCLEWSFSLAQVSQGRAGSAADPRGMNPTNPQHYSAARSRFCISSQQMNFRSCPSGSRSWPGSLGGPGSGERMALVSAGVRVWGGG